MGEGDDRFSTPRTSARRAGYASSSEDERFITPRTQTSARSTSSDVEYSTARHEGGPHSSEEQEQPFYSGREEYPYSGRRMSHVHEHYSSPRANEYYAEVHPSEYSYSDRSTEQQYNSYNETSYENEESYTDNSYYEQDQRYEYAQEEQQYEGQRYEDQQYEDQRYEEDDVPKWRSNEDVTENEIADVFSMARHNKVMHVEDLLDSGIPPDITDTYGNTILSIACQNGLKKMAKAALRRGADINACNLKGNTALHFCHAYGYGDTLGAYLISKGADSTVRNEDGYTCYQGLG